MKFRSSLRTVALTILAAVAAIPTAHSAVMVSNLDEATLSGSPVNINFWFANRFVTDNSAASFTLQNVALSMNTAGNISSNLFVSIYSDSSLTPGTQLASLSGNFSPATEGNYTYTSPGLTLLPNTSYWVVAGVASGAGDYTWSLTLSNSSTGPWNIPSTATHTHSGDGGSSWDAATDGFARQFSVSATAVVPEPATAAALAGLGALGLAALLRRRSRAA